MKELLRQIRINRLFELEQRLEGIHKYHTIRADRAYARLCKVQDERLTLIDKVRGEAA